MAWRYQNMQTKATPGYWLLQVILCGYDIRFEVHRGSRYINAVLEANPSYSNVIIIDVA